MTTSARRLLVVVGAVLALLLPASVANAATASKLEVLYSWTQTSVTSYNAWNAARINRAPWESYHFDWSTDYCSASPDIPLGYDFRLPCWHHDFGYRNYKAVGRFPANKSRVDDMFYADMRRKCATYSLVLRPPCLSLAWTYYQAVRAFGSTAAVSSAELQVAARMKRDAMR